MATNIKNVNKEFYEVIDEWLVASGHQQDSIPFTEITWDWLMNTISVMHSQAIQVSRLNPEFDLFSTEHEEIVQSIEDGVWTGNKLKILEGLWLLVDELKGRY